MPLTDAGHPGIPLHSHPIWSGNFAINIAVPGRSESVLGHNRFSWERDTQQCLSGPWGNSGLSTYICFIFSVPLSPSLGPGVWLSQFCTWLLMVACPTPRLSFPPAHLVLYEILLCNTKTSTSEGRETGHRNNAGGSQLAIYLLWGKIIHSIHIIESLLFLRLRSIICWGR